MGLWMYMVCLPALLLLVVVVVQMLLLQEWLLAT
jgi:hypothetical protein